MMKKSLGILIFLCATLVGWAAAVGAPAESVHTYDLLPQVVAQIQKDGQIIWRSGAGASVFLTGEMSLAAMPRRNTTPAPQLFVVAEGADGGHRGFSARKDDDNDGAVNEDQLDGLDNDHDGRIDEDYAAISDGMVAVDFKNGGARAEYYHWTTAHLRGTTFLSLAGPSFYQFDLTGENWREVTTHGLRHTLAGKSEASQLVAYVAQPRRADSTSRSAPCQANDRLWVGVARLSPAPTDQTIIDGNQLKLSLGQDPQPVAVCVAESWAQLNQMLNEASRVHAGVTDPITGDQATWIVPPLCAKCRLASAPSFRWATEPNGDLRITAYLAAGVSGALDPDLFRLAGHPLGSPDEVIWQPDLGAAVATKWQCSTAAQIERGGELPATPYPDMVGLLDHSDSGRLSFVYSNRNWDIPSSLQQIRGYYLDGRAFTADLNSAPARVSGLDLGKPETKDEPLRLSNQQLRLSPQLLEGYPNPFPSVITLRFRVPATIGEAFVWPEAENGAPRANLSAAVPWESGTPQVSVKIYAISGEELVTLFSGNEGPGENTVQWSGQDSFGRPMASGTYFCKLQMDKWSTTHRIVFLR